MSDNHAVTTVFKSRLQRQIQEKILEYLSEEHSKLVTSFE